MFRTKLSDRKLPGYSRGEETFNMVSHIVGGGIGVTAFLACIIVAAYCRNVWGIVSGAVYGGSLILLFTMSSIYHGLRPEMAKKVFQVLDHCTIYVLIAGTYTPILLCAFRQSFPLDAWLSFGVIWGLAAVGITLTSIDLHRFRWFSLACYLGMGWFAAFSFKKLILVLGWPLFAFLLAGGICYTIGAAFYVLGKSKKWRYIHSVFHIFVDIAALLHFLGIVIYVMPG